MRGARSAVGERYVSVLITSCLHCCVSQPERKRGRTRHWAVSIVASRRSSVWCSIGHWQLRRIGEPLVCRQLERTISRQRRDHMRTTRPWDEGRLAVDLIASHTLALNETFPQTILNLILCRSEEFCFNPTELSRTLPSRTIRCGIYHFSRLSVYKI